MTEPTRRGPWTVHSVRRIYDNPWIGVSESTVTDPNGNPGIYGVCHFSGYAVGVVALDEEGCTYLVGQHRFPNDYYSWELPEGGAPKDVPILDSAKRELKEEAGLTASDWELFLTADTCNAITDEVAYGYLAWNLETGEQELDESEQISVKRLPFRDALEMAVSGEIRDMFTQMMLVKVDLLGRRDALPKRVQELLGY